MHFRIPATFIAPVALSLAYKSLLDISYLSIIYGKFDIYSLQLNPLKIILGYLIVAVLSPTLSPRWSRPSEVFYSILFYSILVPTLVIFGMADEETMFSLAVVGVFVVVRFFSSLKFLKMTNVRASRTLAIMLLTIISAGIIGLLIQNGGLRFFNLNILRVYEFREQSRAVVGSGILTYLNFWLSKVILPTLLAVCLLHRRYILALLVLGIGVLAFGIMAHKIILAILVLVVALWVLSSFGRPGLLLGLGFVGLVLGPSLWYWATGDIVWASLAIRRALFTPALLNFAYYDVFVDQPFIALSNSILSGLITYPYDVPPPFVVSNYLLGHTQTSMNNGFVATGYMHFGYGGMIIFGAIVGLVLWLADSIAYKRLPWWFAASVIAGPMVSVITSADLTTSFLTHGLLPAMIILYLCASRPLRVRLVSSVQHS